MEGRDDLGLLWQKPIKDPYKGMFSAAILAATTLRESVQQVVSLVTGVAFAGACIVSGGQVVAALKALRGLKPIKTVRKNR